MTDLSKWDNEDLIQRIYSIGHGDCSRNYLKYREELLQNQFVQEVLRRLNVFDRMEKIQEAIRKQLVKDLIAERPKMYACKDCPKLNLMEIQCKT